MTAGSTTFAPHPAPFAHERALAILAWSARSWFVAMLAAQLMFAAYIVVLYGGAALAGEFGTWNRVMAHGYRAGAPAANAATAFHLGAAALLMLSGALQLPPRLRTLAPRLHRWNGRLYLGAAIGASLTGIGMVWWRGAAGDLVQHLGTTFNGLLILLCAGMALQRILAGDVAAHRRWALRLFLAVSGVLFFRVGLMLWLALHGGPAGFDPQTFTGPFLSFLAFAQSLGPLLILELYLRCRARGGVSEMLAMAVLLAVLTLALAGGSVVATAGLWLPHM
jgi:hypothetical protein